MTIKIIFLGTSDAVPSIKRNHTSIFLSYKGENILVDCGEGTQRQLRRAGINPCSITKLLITHWHADHVLGIAGLMQTLSLSGYNKKLQIFGPRGTKDFMNRLLSTFAFRGKHPAEIREIEGKFFENDDFYLESEKMSHGIPCNAYSFILKGQRRIDKEKLKKSELSSGPLIAKLKQGKDIVYNGKKYRAKELTFLEAGKKISFVFDTSMNKSIIPFVKNADVLICESTFSSKLEKKAGEFKHLTSKQAANIAKKAKVKKLFLTHVSQRYDKHTEEILNEARKIFKNSFLANDLEAIEIKK